MSTPSDKYSAVWVSHSSLSDFLQCPRAYFLKNVYKDPKTRHKMTIMSPPLALGQAVHEVLEGLSTLPTEKRFADSLVTKFDQVWQKFSGKKGGFADPSFEQKQKERGKSMLRRVMEHPGALARKAIKLKEVLPQFWLSQDDNIMLCGKLDWIEYMEQDDQVHIIDFKTSKQEEDPESLQLPIYHLLAHYSQRRPVAKVSYWYLEFNDELTPQPLPDLMEAQERVLKVAKQIKLARQLERFVCPHGKDGCFACRPFEAVLRGEAECIGTDDMRRDVFVVKRETAASNSVDEREEGMIL